MQRRSSHVKILSESKETLLQVESANQLVKRKSKATRLNVTKINKNILDKERLQIKKLHKTILNNPSLHQLQATGVTTIEIINILKKLKRIDPLVI